MRRGSPTSPSTYLRAVSSMRESQEASISGHRHHAAQTWHAARRGAIGRCGFGGAFEDSGGTQRGAGACSSCRSSAPRFAGSGSRRRPGILPRSRCEVAPALSRSMRQHWSRSRGRSQVWQGGRDDRRGGAATAVRVVPAAYGLGRSGCSRNRAHARRPGRNGSGQISPRSVDSGPGWNCSKS